MAVLADSQLRLGRIGIAFLGVVLEVVFFLVRILNNSSVMFEVFLLFAFVLSFCLLDSLLFFVDIPFF